MHCFINIFEILKCNHGAKSWTERTSILDVYENGFQLSFVTYPQIENANSSFSTFMGTANEFT